MELIFSRELSRGLLSRISQASLLGCISLAGTAVAQTTTSPASATVSYAYDPVGNLTQVTTGSNVTKITYDALSRRTKVAVVNGWGEIPTNYQYDLRDQVTKVTDARSVVTSYSIDGHGNLLETASKDTGLTENTYDEAGNLKTSKDAKQQLSRYDYDALNRVTKITYHDNSVVSYIYDQSASAIGQLSQITDISGSIRYDYDDFGRIKSETRSIGGTTYATGYRYDAAGRLAGIDYPGGRAINYQYDAVGQLRQIDSLLAGTVTPIIKDVSYEPFGPVRTITFGNGKTHARSFDQDGRMSTYTLSSQTMKIGYDSANRITSIADAANLPAETKYGYDLMDRLTSVQTSTTAKTYEYDNVGNRKRKLLNGAATTYTYEASSNRLTAVGPVSMSTDVNGSITNNGKATFNYDVRGRMISANTSIGLVQYTINALGQRVRKVTPTESTVFHYDLSGKLIAETTQTGANVTTTEYVFLGDIPVAVLK